jgi:hypothetical protein
MVYNYHPRPCTQNLENSTELVLDCQTYAHKLRKITRSLQSSGESRKKSEKLLTPSARPNLTKKGGCFKTVALKWGDIQIILCSDARKLFYCWAI